MALLYAGEIPKWDVSQVRPAGARLKTFGGRASGPEPLNDLFVFVVSKFKNSTGRKLSSLEAHDILCKIGEVVVVGGVRRSAMISLSDLGDSKMAHAKAGNWWDTSGHRALANNSAIYEVKPDVGEFMREWCSIYESHSGERGIFNRYASELQVAKNGRRTLGKEWGTNPCSEIILRPYQFCNLSSVIVRAGDTLETLLNKVEMATILGTLQSTMTYFPYLRKVWQTNTEEERLLGVSMTGILDNALLNNYEDTELPARLEAMKNKAIETNAKFAAAIGINASVAITAIKPEGCTSPDTVVKTTHGPMSLRDLFKMAGHDVEEYKDKKDVWLSTHDTLPQVYDENNELQDITKLYINGVSEVFEIEFEDGKTYKFTPNHMLLTTNGWKRVDELTVDDNIISH
jgi:ribonucleoside-diphosphate reductase alpha chain